MLLFVVIFCVMVALGFCLFSGWSDWNGLVIPNTYPAGIIIAFLAAFGIMYFLAPDLIHEYFFGLKSHAMAFGLTFIGTFILFSLRMIGAGDSKLVTAVALWTGLKGLFPLLFFMGIVGGILGLVALYIRKAKPVRKPKEGSWVERVQKGESAVPYGIAIAVGAIAAFWQIGYFEPENLTLLAHSGAGLPGG